MKKVGFLIIGLLLLAVVAALGCIAGEAGTDSTSTVRGNHPRTGGKVLPPPVARWAYWTSRCCPIRSSAKMR